MNYHETSVTHTGNLNIKNLLPQLGIEKVREEIITGLTAEHKYISSKFFYDQTGSELFEEITQLPEYYPTRTEKQILNNINLSFIKDFNNFNIVELGSGDHSKINLLFKKIPTEYISSTSYFPVDISASALSYAANRLLNLYPQITVKGLVADFMHQTHLIPSQKNSLYCFFGSTIGNFLPPQVAQFLKSMNKIMLSDNYFLIGFDAIKNVETLENAYNDNQGITAKFNLNILNVLNKLADTNFETKEFKHIAFFNQELNRIEMHIEALKSMTVKSKYLPKSIQIAAGERIHTENSHKFSISDIENLSVNSGFHLEKIYTDELKHFNVALLKKT